MLCGIARAVFPRCAPVSRLAYPVVASLIPLARLPPVVSCCGHTRAMSGAATAGDVAADGGKREEGGEPLRIYFAASIRGGRQDIEWYQSLIKYCQGKGNVLTEHIGKPSIEAMGETGVTEEFIYTRDMDWLRTAECVISEVTQPSLGVGYELGFAESINIPVLCLFRSTSGKSLSAMIRGNATFTTKDYAELPEAYACIDEFLATLKKKA